MITSVRFIIEYWEWLAYTFSLFWGVRGAVLDYSVRYQTELIINKGNWNWKDTCKIVFLWSSFQFIFNAIGSLAGWYCTYILLSRFNISVVAYNPSLTDLILFVMAFLGITGLLPQTVYGLVESIKWLTMYISKGFKQS